jgi:hypothetical protein
MQRIILALSILVFPALAYAGAPVQAYVPGMGETMGATQMRHAKLWLAGKAGNWALARYELGEIEEGFADVAKYHPIFKGAPVSVFLHRYTAKPLAELGASIDHRNRAGFRQAFDDLTHACNACHRAAGHAYIVIQRPSASTFSNQLFSVRPR